MDQHMADYICGIILLATAYVLLFVLLWVLHGFIRNDNKPLYQKKLKKIVLPEKFLTEVKRTYEVTQSIRGMLDLLKAVYTKGRINTRICAAEDYLLNSRYKDFETTLYQYLSDCSAECEALYQELITREIQKRYRLPCHQK